MRKISFFIALFIAGKFTAMAQPDSAARLNPMLAPSKVDFDAYETLSKEVKEYRKDRLVNLATFLEYAKNKNTVILDTRSTEMFNRKHVKGAIHLNFSDFTQSNLAALIPSNTTRILIYCNNNFDNDPIRFATKSYVPMPTYIKDKRGRIVRLIPALAKKEITLALNIPTFINLYGYGYRNVYELADLVPVFFGGGIEFEGTDVRSKVAAN